ncbi:DUF1795 domain-containing protein [Candidatus Ornithobacterium hominis]|uniref:hypothetical protein n=1 Tax=Candidatus Ornithobacterium hominis TaxID=2497989 RepID=UPI0024BCA0A1|nr:hypothetical protein [Candidatus Ornithobacterium hominis]CAI9429380.1 DUF1795 domain-containing protein [Candidatus Ornithobacterium hominis]
MKYLISIIFLFGIFQTNAQTKKEIDNGLYVNFPSEPEYKTTNSASTYVTKSENCIFMVLIQRNAIPNYAEYVKAKQKWSASEIAKVENSFLDNAVKGKLDYTGNSGKVNSIKVGKFSGREISYSAINPASGERGMRHTKLFLVRDKAISFEVWYLNDTETAEQERDYFLNSIRTQQ